MFVEKRRWRQKNEERRRKWGAGGEEKKRGRGVVKERGGKGGWEERRERLERMEGRIGNWGSGVKEKEGRATTFKLLKDFLIWKRIRTRRPVSSAKYWLILYLPAVVAALQICVQICWPIISRIIFRNHWPCSMTNNSFLPLPATGRYIDHMPTSTRKNGFLECLHLNFTYSGNAPPLYWYLWKSRISCGSPAIRV